MTVLEIKAEELLSKQYPEVDIDGIKSDVFVIKRRWKGSEGHIPIDSVALLKRIKTNVKSFEIEGGATEYSEFRSAEIEFAWLIIDKVALPIVLGIIGTYLGDKYLGKHDKMQIGYIERDGKKLKAFKLSGTSEEIRADILKILKK